MEALRRTEDRRFTDRHTAGRMLAARLADEDWHEPVVLGLARGGVPVAYEVARTLRAQLAVQVVRKIGAPGQPEFGLGAVTAGGPPVYDHGSLLALGLTEDDLRATCEREEAEARRRAELYGRDRDPGPLEGRDLIVCDDGLATGVTARAALRHLRREQPRTLAFAAPVCAPDASERLLTEADQVHCVARPAYFQAVGQFYRDFHQTTDQDVLALLDAAERDLARGRR
jgi:predicted phosphoribosyltransferase